LARLEREGLTDWIEAILLRKISAFAVVVELGWAKRPQTLFRGKIATRPVRRSPIRHPRVDSLTDGCRSGRQSAMKPRSYRQRSSIPEALVA
jgi:hypothetical protein